MFSLSPLRLGAVLALVLVSSTACDRTKPAPDGPHIVCTTVMVGDVVRGVAGDGVKVTILMGPDVDPHLYRPTRDDVAALTSADAIFANGFHLEANLIPTLDKLRTEGTPVTLLAESILEPREKISEGVEVVDPHVWMDPSLWARTANVVAEALSSPSMGTKALHWEGVTHRARSIRARYLAIDKEAEAALFSILPEDRVLISAHDAFGYFGRRYGLEVHAIQGISTASEAGLGAIEELVDLIVERRALAVFFESTVSERSVRALVEGAAARDHRVDIGGVLHTDAPGDAKSYTGMMRHNVRTIALALGGTVELPPETDPFAETKPDDLTTPDSGPTPDSGTEADTPR